MNTKYIIIGLLLLSVNGLHAQQSGSELSEKIAKRIKDSINLTDKQYEDIKRINEDIRNQKQKVWEAHAINDSLRHHLQIVENTRDSLYKVVLPLEKFELYRSRKSILVNNN